MAADATVSRTWSLRPNIAQGVRGAKTIDTSLGNRLNKCMSCVPAYESGIVWDGATFRRLRWGQSRTAGIVRRIWNPCLNTGVDRPS